MLSYSAADNLSIHAILLRQHVGLGPWACYFDTESRIKPRFFRFYSSVNNLIKHCFSNLAC